MVYLLLICAFLRNVEKYFLEGIWGIRRSVRMWILLVIGVVNVVCVDYYQSDSGVYQSRVLGC